MDQNFNKALFRIKEINWSDTVENKYSHYILVQEFINRGNLFKDQYCKTEMKGLAIFSAAAMISADIPTSIEEKCNVMGLNTYGWIVNLSCKFYLEWAYLIDHENTIAMKHSELYEPLIKLFERGGHLTYHQNSLYCGKFSWPKSSYNLKRSDVACDITDDTLDMMDRIYSGM